MRSAQDTPVVSHEAAGALPADVTSFVGRRQERRDVRTLLAEARLVTLTGFGGIGKTRLALKLGADVRRAFKDGVVFVPLAGQTDPSMLAGTIASALGLQGRSSLDPAPALVEFLRERSVLLILDNCEHMIDAVAVLTDTLLRTCRDVRVLATSREPLRIEGEATHPVQPLAVPPPATDEPLQSFESVALFLDRARALMGEIELAGEARTAIARIVSRLEGIPLAIELAAGRLRGMSLTELEAALTERWDLLTRGSRSAPIRQQTMAACIEWSFDLCTPTERQLWSRLSVFVDGFELDAARAVAGPLDSDTVDDVLLDLVAKSIVVADTSQSPTRFRMLPPIRHRGSLHLADSPDWDVRHQKHVDWCFALAHRVNREWMSPAQIEGMERLRREINNLVAALDYTSSLPGPAARAGLAVGADMLEVGLADGFFRQGLMWFDRLFERDPEASPERVGALRTAAWFSAMQGNLPRATRYLDEGRTLAEHEGGLLSVRMTQATAFVAMFSGEYDLAARHFDAALRGFEEFDDVSQQAHTWSLVSLNSVFRGDIDGALAAYDACRALCEPAGEHWYLSYASWIAGLAHWLAGRPAEAADLQRESLRSKRLTKERVGIGVSLEALAWITAPNAPERAARMLGAAQRIWDRTETSTASLPGLAALHDACVRDLVAALGQANYDAIHADGALLEAQDAVDYALEEVASPKPRRTTARKTPDSTAKALTRRERQVAELVAADLTNQEIASTLVISKRTAETHVENILTKLGFTNRAQITSWMQEYTDRAQSFGASAQIRR